MTPFALAKSILLFARIAHNPNKLDLVFDLRDSGADPALLEALTLEMKKLPGANAAYAAKVRLGGVDIGELRALPAGTLGRAYGEFLHANQLSPDSLRTTADHTDALYTSTHLAETHDLWHVLTGFGPDIAGEAGLQGFYAAQHPSPLPAALISAILLNAAIELSNDKMRTALDAVVCGYQMGKRATSLFGFAWRDNFARPLESVRRELGIEPVQGAAHSARMLLKAAPRTSVGPAPVFVHYA